MVHGVLPVKVASKGKQSLGWKRALKRAVTTVNNFFFFFFGGLLPRIRPFTSLQSIVTRQPFDIIDTLQHFPSSRFITFNTKYI